MIYFLTYPFFFTIIRLICRVVGRLRTSGEENVPATGGLIYCPNHISDSDPAVFFVSQPRRAWFIGKQELFEIPVIGWFFHHFHAFPIKRYSADRVALRRAEDCLKRGEPILLFPEGRGSPDGKLQPLLAGAPLLSVRTGVPIIPVGLAHTNELMPYGTLRLRVPKHPLTVTIGPPLRPQQFSHMKHGEAVEAMTKALGEELARLTNQAPPPLQEKPKRRPSATEVPAEENASPAPD